ncbi:hypothetical protein G6514_000352 [Epicoccum nigrum]|nr:hypothetical protein G6514_000352 [Epicoccum nigrum]
MYIEWLYRKRVLADYDDYNQYSEDLVNAYCAGQQLQDDSFCNAILHATVEWFSDIHDYPSDDFLARAYNKTSGPCSLRKLMVDFCLNSGAEQADLEYGWGDLPEQFVRELALAFMKTSSSEEEDWTLETPKGVTKLQGMDDTEDEVSESEGDESDED